MAQAKAVLEASLIGGTSEASPVKAEGLSAGAGSGSSPAAVNGKRRYCCATLVSVDAVVPVILFFLPEKFTNFSFSLASVVWTIFMLWPYSFWTNICT